jgi:hypothetical protein
MLQQALMENALCLIGFSGDDPNFLSWTGWVRDNLGEHTPSIYLCGILNLSPSQRKLLQDRRIIPIDLSHLPLDQGMDSALRHERDLEWLLLSLLNGKPEDRRSWPVPSDSIVERPSDGLPTILPRPSTMADPWEVARPQDLPDAEMLRKLLESWKGQREQYPGWAVCPRENRNILWQCTKYWFGPLTESLSLVKPWEKLFLLRELNWRLERCLVPLSQVEEQVNDVVACFNPFSGRLDLPDAEFHGDDPRWQYLDWEHIRVCWVELVFALARRARERLDELAFLQWMGLLEKVLSLNKDWMARHWYEDCLWSLLWLDLEALPQKLDSCPVKTQDFPALHSKRASLMAECGLLQEARRLAQEALDVIRRDINPDIDDYMSLSQEGWTMMVSHLLGSGELGLSQGTMPMQRDRWEKLSAFKCNPTEDLNRTARTLSEGRPMALPSWEEQVEFDPGHRMKTPRYDHDSEFEKCLPAFQFLRLLDDGGLPVRLVKFDLWRSCAVNAAKWIASLEPEMAISYMIRNSNCSDLVQWCNRVRVATMEQGLVEKLYGRLSSALRKVIGSLNRQPGNFSILADNLESRLLVLLLELQSRFCFRLSNEQKAAVFELAVEVYELPLFTGNHHLHDCVKSLLERALFAMDREEILCRMPRLLSLPVPGESRFSVSLPQLWGEPFESARLESFGVIEAGLDLSAWKEPIHKLFQLAADGSTDARTRALVRLERLDKMRALDEDQRKEFAEVLWSHTNPQTQFPSNTSFEPWCFLLLPEPEPGKVKALFKNHILKAKFPRFITKQAPEEVLANLNEAKGSPNRNTPITEILRATLRIDLYDHECSERLVDWTPEEILIILRRSAAWWHVNRPDLKDPEIASPFAAGDELRAELSKLVPLFADVILPRLRQAPQTERGMALRVLQEMEEEGFCVTSCAPATLFVDPTQYDAVVRRLRLGLNSSDEEEIVHSIEGFFVWFLYCHNGALPAPPQDLFQELIAMVSSRRQPGLELAMQKLLFIIRRMPERFTEDMVSSLCVGLEYLKNETELPRDMDKEFRTGSRPTIPVEKRPDCRKDAAGLAHALYKHLSQENVEIPQILLEWREASQSDPLPEVRWAWPKEAPNC